jgi:tight adherence protein C
MILLVFSVLLFLTVAAAAYAVWGQVNADANPVQVRLRQLRTSGGGSGREEGVERPPLLIGLVARIGGFMPTNTGRDALRTGLVRAGYRRPEAMMFFLGCKLVCAVVVPVAWITYAYLSAKALPNAVAWTAISAMVGFYLPTMFIGWRQKQRHDGIQGALPDALDLMVVCVEAGLGIGAALYRVAGEIRIASNDLADELVMVHQEMQTGISRADALRNLAHRTGVEEIYMLTAMLIQTDRLGTSIANTLRAHAESMRVRRRQRAEIMARKAGIKLAFPLVFLILPALLVVILGPAAIQLMKALKAE